MKKVDYNHLVRVLFLTGLPACLFAQFFDISRSAGIDNTGRNSGVAVADFDGDEWDDVYVSVQDGPNRLYRNLGNGVFQEMAVAAGVAYEKNTRVSLWGDLNNDGFPELYLGNNDQPDVLYRNNGDGTFTDVSWEAGIVNVAKPYAVLMADINSDGYLDIYIANFKSENKFYLNHGDLTFSDYTYRSGALDMQNAMGSFFCDYDNDRDLDLFLTHDGQPYILYQNNGEGRFTDVSARAGVNYQGFGMGTDFADVNRDGFLDIYVTNLYENVLFLNNGDGTFAKIGKSAGVDDYGMGWGTNFLDFDNDGWVDIYVGNDSYFSPFPNVLYRNQGNLTFEKVETNGPVASLQGTYGSSTLDLDLDGRIDLFLANTGQQNTNQLFHNSNANGNWIGLQLEGVQSNRDAVGARVVAWDDLGGVHVDEVAAGSGYASQSTLRLHFGLGEATRLDSMVIRWPNGLDQNFLALPAGNYYKILEGQAPEILKLQTKALSNRSFQAGAGNLGVFPNPASEGVNIHFQLIQAASFQLHIMDVLGRTVLQLADNKGMAGENLWFWDGRDATGQVAPAGIYFIRLTENRKILTGQICWQP